VKFQFQMSTITDGFVAADYFLRYPGRFFSMHLQDIDMSAQTTEVPPEGRSTRRRRPRYPQAALGRGSIDWVKTFQAARTGGVRNYFVEQSWDLTQQSVAFLKTLKV
jgi:sugar phosphate isomerase/epimerase